MDAENKASTQFSSIHLKRLILWLAISLIASLVCCEGESYWRSLEPQYQMVEVIGHPLDQIFFSSSYVAIITSVYVFHSTSSHLCFTMWTIFGVGMFIAVIAHLVLFLMSRRVVLYFLIALHLLAITGGEAGEIAAIKSAPLVLPVNPISV